VLGAAVEDRRIPRNPCVGVRLPKRKHADRGYLSHGQVAALAAVVEGQAEVVRFLAYTGLRWGEMAALRVQDFDMLRRRVNVSRSVTVNARSKGWLRWRAQVAENCAAARLRPRPLTRGTRTSRVHVQRVAIE
jgi:integrase